MSTSKSAVLSIFVSDLFGNESTVNVVSPDIQIEKVKESAIKQLTENESSSNFSQFRLILVKGLPRLLCDDKTVKQELIEDGDCMILLSKSRNKQVSSLVKDGVVSHDGPNQAAINRATEGLPDFTNVTDKSKIVGADLSSTSQVEQTFRKVLLALLELSYKFMHFDQDVPLEAVSKPPVDAKQLTALMDMGFSEQRARKALVTNNMDQNLAMEWLLSHTEEGDESVESNDEVMDTDVVKVVPKKRIKTRSRAFVPNPTHLSLLLDMGFTREQSIKALRINGNNPNTACEWLLSDHKSSENVVDDNDEPLSPNTELYKALISNPTIHIGLHDQKVLEALEDMVENPWRRNNWAYESAVGNVLLQILKLYNKYSTTASHG